MSRGLVRGEHRPNSFAICFKYYNSSNIVQNILSKLDEGFCKIKFAKFGTSRNRIFIFLNNYRGNTFKCSMSLSLIRQRRNRQPWRMSNKQTAHSNVLQKLLIWILASSLFIYFCLQLIYILTTIVAHTAHHNSSV